MAKKDRPWTREEWESVVNARRSGESVQSIADRTGRTKVAIFSKSYKSGYNDEYNKARLQILRDLSLTNGQAGMLLGISTCAARRARLSRGITGYRKHCPSSK